MCQFEQVSPSPTPITILAIGNCYLWAGYLFSNAKARCKPESKVACHRSNPLHRLRQVFFNVHFSWIIFLGFTYSWSVSHRFLIPLDHDTSHDPWPWPWLSPSPSPWSAKGKSCNRKEGEEERWKKTMIPNFKSIFRCASIPSIWAEMYKLVLSLWQS